MTRRNVKIDKHLLTFETYEDYLDSLVNHADLYYLKSTSAARMIAESGYRNAVETLDQRSFRHRHDAIKKHLNPMYKPYIQNSELVEPKDPLQVQLSLRETSNRLGILSTIIFVRVKSKTNSDVSGYIDYADRLASECWVPFFRGKRRLIPSTRDLAFYNWKTGRTKMNETKNYQPIIVTEDGLTLKNLHNRKFIYIDPRIAPKNVTARLYVESDRYDHVVIYDYFLKSSS